MARLSYSAITSLDLCVEDRSGDFLWAAPDDEVMAFVTELERPVGMYLYGRRMYETMRYWEDPAQDEGFSPFEREWAQVWRAADKVVFSRTLGAVTTARTAVVRSFDRSSVRAMKEREASDLSIGGAELAAHALRAGLVDEVRLFLNPVVVGGGKSALPDGFAARLDLLEERRFTAGVVYLRYAVRG
ncbi:dihydrofolate reductase family protein [Gryllotalpicola ginsengisoli]|uniref:dihydrofolate reductase family protein n=1 Tax=Gryllotalpicola ginsengisoli TaxID=444608 RepID=UPI0003B3821A|nr:dihydrofolate reductase family protein [Gryllotalpicola ginsengisoli]